MIGPALSFAIGSLGVLGVMNLRETTMGLLLLIDTAILIYVRVNLP